MSASDTAADRVSISVLGTLRASRDGADLDLRGPRPRLLLSLLVAASGTPVPIDRLLDDLYGDDQPPTARKSAQVHVSNLRRALGEGSIVTTHVTTALAATELAAAHGR